MDQTRTRYLKDNFAVSTEELAALRPEGCSETDFYIQLLKLRGKKDTEALYFRLIREETGKTECEIRKELSFICSMDLPIEFSLETYYKYGAYTLNVLNKKETLVPWAGKVSSFLVLRDHIIKKLERKELSFPDFEKKMEEARCLLSELLSDGRKKELFEAIKDIRPDLSINAAAFDKVTVDMELTVSVLGFVPEEYVSYHFWEKSVPERLEFVSDSLRIKVGKLLNSQEGRDVLNNKYLTYQTLQPLYGRTIRQMDADKGYPAFAKAFQENSVLVKKNNFQSLGRETEKIEVTGNADLHALYERITQNGQYFILEDLIRPHQALKRLNPDSVNTVRIVTFLDHKGPIILDSFLRAGRKGSFVDNGGNGGIFVHVDPVKGITDSQGIDEHGFVYQSHPDHAYRFSGIRLPLWDEALTVAKKAAQKIHGARYVGWDIVFTEENRWIIVEGNAMTMYIGQQAPLGLGKRKALLASIHYGELICSEHQLGL